MKTPEKSNSSLADQAVEKSREKTLLKMDWGNLLVLDRERQEIQLLDKNKTAQLTITVKPEGLSIQINAIELNINAIDQLNLSGKKISLSASEELVMKSAGDLIHQIDGDFTLDIGGTNYNRAKIQKMTAELGNVEIKANDDVRLDGERVLFNCD
ncbi:MAG: hypothetical protein ABI151_16580 [Chitinophagaceae bacterium]